MDADFYRKDVLEVAPGLLGQVVVRQLPRGKLVRATITETEAYRGEEDLACHARFGRTKRTEVMYHEGGKVYVYLIYGMYWMLNVVTGPAEHPQAVLIRGLELADGTKLDGPGKVGKHLQLDRSFYGLDLVTSGQIWLERGTCPAQIGTTQRIGIDYAGVWAAKPWRFIGQGL